MPKTIPMFIYNYLRGAPWLLVGLGLAVVIAVIAPWQIGVLVWSLTKLTLGAYLGYWIDRSLSSGPRPHEMESGPAHDAALLRRAVIISAVIVAMGLGV